jgi:hypothetical protein
MLQTVIDFNECPNRIIGHWVVEKSGGRCLEGATAIGIEKDGVLQVGIMYDGWTGVNGSVMMHSRCDNPKATSKKFYWMIFDYPFNQLKVRRCTVMVHIENHHAIEINKRLGFSYEATLKDYFPDGDAIIMKMTREECKWIKDEHETNT